MFDRIKLYLKKRSIERSFQKTLQTMLDAGIFEYTNERDLCFTDDFIKFCISHHPPQLELPVENASGALSMLITTHAVSYIKMNNRKLTTENIMLIARIIDSVVDILNIDAVIVVARPEDPMFG